MVRIVKENTLSVPCGSGRPRDIYTGNLFCLLYLQLRNLKLETNDIFDSSQVTRIEGVDKID